MLLIYLTPYICHFNVDVLQLIDMDGDWMPHTDMDTETELHLCMHVHVHDHIQENVRKHVHTCTHARTRTHAHARTCTHARAHVWVWVRRRVCMCRWSPLMWAVKRAHYDTAELLLKRGADPAHSTTQGCNPRGLLLSHVCFM